MTTAYTTPADNIAQRVDTGFYQTSTATQAEGWPEDSNNWMHLLAVTHANGANYYSMQLAGGYFDNDHFYVRKAQVGDISQGALATQPWRELVHTGSLHLTGPLNVRTFGAKLDGSDDTAAYIAARNAATNHTVIEVPYGKFQANVLPPPQTVDATKCVLWSLPGVTWTSGALVDGIGADIVDTFYSDGPGKLLVQNKTTLGSRTMQTFQRNVTHGQGGDGVLETVLVHTNDQGEPTDYVYSFRASVHSNSHNPAGNDCAGYFQGWRNPGGTTPLWSGCFETRDKTGLNSSQTAAMLGVEIGIFGSGYDDANRRIGADIVVGADIEKAEDTIPAGVFFEAYAGVRVSTVGGSEENKRVCWTKHGVSVESGVSDSAFDASKALWRPDTTHVALRTGAGAHVDFSSDNSHMLRWQPGEGLQYRVGGTPVLTVRDGGVVNRPDAPASEVPTSRNDPRGSYGDEVKYGDRVYFKTSSGWYSIVMSSLP